MMQILSHRGYWKTVEEKNSPIAFERSFSLNYGTETDIRDYLGDLVISHDIANAHSISCGELLEKYNNHNPTLPLALNIKADGLQLPLKTLLTKYNITNYFVFDMSVPDTIGYIKNDIRFFTRLSEYEIEPSFYEQCAGIWLDAFESIWYNAAVIEKHLNNGKEVAIVSSDLHKRPVEDLWEMLKYSGVYKNILLCTDIPEDASIFFSE
ncbi:MAG: hypothetical protein FD136_648 [Chitinophagaceae bacterium]|nr:MAG: hypothetical protein FD136_648 [Chitinophagaceae bacterium]